MAINKNKLSLDSFASKIAGLGVPGLIFFTAYTAALSTGLAGAAAITAALAAIGPGGMLVGIGIIGVSGMISEALTQFGFDAILSKIVKGLYKKGETKDSIIHKIDNYKISKSLKQKLKEKIEAL